MINQKKEIRTPEGAINNPAHIFKGPENRITEIEPPQCAICGEIKKLVFAIEKDPREACSKLGAAVKCHCGLAMTF